MIPVDANGVPLHHYFARDVASKVLMDMINALPDSVYSLNHTDAEWVTDVMLTAYLGAIKAASAGGLTRYGDDAADDESEPDASLLAWAVSNCYTLARRRLKAQSADAEWWQHVFRICEKAGAKSQGVLRAAVPTEITDGSA